MLSKEKKSYTMIRSCENNILLRSPESSLGLNHASENVHERHLTPALTEKDERTFVYISNVKFIKTLFLYTGRYTTK